MTTDLHNAIEQYLRAAFTVEELPTVETYPKLNRKITCPALLIELDELVPADDPGTGELGLTARFAAYAVTGLDTAAAQLQAANLAATAALKIFEGSRFGQPVGVAKVSRVARDEFKPDLVGYAVWAVEWSHDLRIGSSVWDGAGVIPTEIYAGLSPDIGADHQPDYELVNPDAQP